MRAGAVLLLLLGGCSRLKAGQDVGAIPIVTGQLSPGSLFTDGSALYWANRGTPPDFLDGSIMTYPLPDGPLHSLADGQISPVSLLLRKGSLYWASSASNGSIMKMALGGTPTVAAANQATPVTLAVDDAGNLYWATSDGQIWFLTSGSDPFNGYVSDIQDSPTSMIVDNTGLYWINSGNHMDNGRVLKRDPFAAVAPAFALSTGLKDPRSLYLSEGTLYWVNGGNGRDSGSVMQLPRGSSRPTSLAVMQNEPTALTVIGQRIVWTTTSRTIKCGASDGGVRTISTEGGSVVELATGGISQPSSVTATADSVFWADLGCDSSGAIYRWPLE